jgi:O-methyltransferase
MKQMLKRMLYPARKIAARFVDVAVDDTILNKVSNFIAAEKIEGDYIEFGVYAGYSFINAYHILHDVFGEHQKLFAWRTERDAVEIKNVWEKMRFFAFDSFQGLPALDRVDRKGRDFAEGKYACTEDAFRENLYKAGVPLNRVVTVAGWFENTCTEETRRAHEMKKAAIVHVDCDLYASAKTALDFVKPLLVDGTIIIFDDWYTFRGNPNLGEQRAFHEWKATMKDWTFTEYQKEGPYRNSFIASQWDANDA